MTVITAETGIMSKLDCLEMSQEETKFKKFKGDLQEYILSTNDVPFQVQIDDGQQHHMLKWSLLYMII